MSYGNDKLHVVIRKNCAITDSQGKTGQPGNGRLAQRDSRPMSAEAPFMDASLKNKTMQNRHSMQQPFPVSQQRVIKASLFWTGCGRLPSADKIDFFRHRRKSYVIRCPHTAITNTDGRGNPLKELYKSRLIQRI